MTRPGDKAAATRARLHEIFLRYRDSLAEHLDVIDDAARAAQAGTLDHERRLRAQQAAHKLAGSAGTFGFAEATRIARQIDQGLEPEKELRPTDLTALVEQAAALRAALPLQD